MATLTNTKIKDTYDGLLKTTDNDVIGASEKVITDGLGNASVLSIGTGSASFSSDIEVNGLTIGKGNGSLSTNTAIGVQALDNATGTGNTAIGYQALNDKTSGSGNTALGNGALRDGATLNSNTGIGEVSLLNISGSRNVGLGYQAGRYAISTTAKTLGDDNIYIGANTKSAAIDTDNEIVIGSNATGNGSNTATYGDGNITEHIFTSGTLSSTEDATINGLTIGLGSGDIVTNTALGAGALLANTSGSGNVSVGQGSMRSNTVGLGNVSVGKDALRLNTTGNYNVAVGYVALYNNIDGADNVAIGYSSLNANTSGSQNIAIGRQALLSNTTGGNNTAIGYSSLVGNITGVNNTAVGRSSLYANTASNNTAVGAYALLDNTTGTSNTAVGYLALSENTTGGYNTSVGSFTLEDNTTGSRNTAVGFNTLDSNTEGSDNTAIGHGALDGNTTGDKNTAVGRAALLRVSTGFQNAALGFEAADDITTGSNNVHIGYQATASSATVSNEIVIGASATGNGSNTATYGNSSIASHHFTSGQVNVAGNLAVDTNTLYVDAAANEVGIGTSTPAAKFHINAGAVSSPRGGGFTKFFLTSDSYTYFELQTPSTETADIIFSDGASGNYGVVGYTHSDDSMHFYTAASEAMRIDSSGNVGIGTSSPSSAAGFDPKLHLESANPFLIYKETDQANSWETGSWGGSYTIFNGASERMRIDSSGNVGIGSSTTDGRLKISAPSGNTQVASIALYGNNGNAFGGSNVVRSKIESSTDGTAFGANMLFYTNDTSNVYQERMRIDSSGRVGIGATPADWAAGAGGGSLRIGSNAHIQDDGNSSYYAHNLYYNGGWKFLDSNAHNGNYILMADDGTMQFANTTNTGTSGQSATVSERMRITSGGDVLIGKTATTLTTDGARLSSTGANLSRTSATVFDMNRNGTDGNVIAFYKDGTNVGVISVTSSSTSYVTSSDYRLKENVVPMEGALDRVDALKPSRFNFIADPATTVDGFLAHEVAEVIPEAISGEKDAVDEEGNPVYQGIDQSKIVPLLVGAIQELKAEIELLKSQING